MYCPKCGEKISSKEKYCHNCGVNIEEFFNSKRQEDKINENEKDEKIDANEDINQFESENKKESKDENSHKKKNKSKLEDLFTEHVNNKKENKESEDFENKNKEKKFSNDNLKNSSEKIEKNNLNEIKDNSKKFFIILKNGVESLLEIIKTSQEKLFIKSENTIEKIVLGNKKYLYILLGIIVISLIPPSFSAMKFVMLFSHSSSMVILAFFTLVATLINIFITGLGSYISLKILGLNYMEKIDKETIKSFTVILVAIVSILKLIVFIFTKNIISLGPIVIGKFSFVIGLLTFIIFLIEDYFLQILIWDKFEKRNYFKVFLTIILTLVIMEIVSYLVFKPTLFILLELL